MRQLSRRQFVRAGAGVALPLFVPASVLGRNGAVAPSERITLATIGTGNRCRRVLEFFMLQEDVHAVAVCDVRPERLAAGKAMVDKKYGNGDCATYSDQFEALARKDIDAVLIATGDRWHSLMSILAAKAGKDIYCEKPMSLFIGEGRAMADSIKRYGTVYQCGHQRRSVDSYRFVREVVQRGMIGELQTLTCTNFSGKAQIKPKFESPPKGFDFDRWLGPTPQRPHCSQLVNGGWNNIWDTGSGTVANMGTHLVDFAQWVRGTELDAPVTYEGTAEWPEPGYFETPITYSVICTYRDGVKLVIRAAGPFADRWTKFEGSEGWIQVHDHTNAVTAEPRSILRMRGIGGASWANAGGHVRNFLEAIKNRTPTICPAENSHRSTSICHAANIALRLGRKVHWDAGTERFVNDDEANRMISRGMRGPWRL